MFVQREKSMKSLLIVFTLLSIKTFATEVVEVKSKIKNVIVYQQGAQIKRTGDYSIKKGVTELKIRGISPYIDPNTLQINATGNIVILDSKHSIFYPEPLINAQTTHEIPLKIKTEIRLLQDSLFDISYDVMSLQNRIDVLNSQKRIIENNGTIKGQGKVNDSIPLLRDALKFYMQEMNTIYTSLLALNKELTIVNRSQTRMNARLNELNNYNRNVNLEPTQNYNPIHEIVITVSANDVATGKVTVSYLVNNAGWTPLYDIRSSNAAGKIELTYKAHVYQNTGIDWENAQLSLSTNNPYTNKTKPTLSPWYLDYSYAIYHNGPSRADDLRESSEYDGATQPGSLYSASQKDEVYSEKKALTADQFITTVEQLLSVEYSIALPYTIKSNNEKNMVLVKTANLDANYLYYTVPKLDASVYLIAKITNLDDLNLLPGKATIFHDGSYLGTTYINSNSLSDTMDLSLGKSSTIIVERNLIKNATKEKVVGDKIIKTFAYSIDVKNLGKLPIELITEDQIPISRNPEIKLTIDNMTKGALNEINGFVTWREKIKALGTVRYEIVYTIEYDKTKPINLASN
jgi:uncharacterized protein (TIGR02231 family)